MIFAVTERGSFRRCRRQTLLTAKNGRHLTTLFSPLYLSTGTLVHSGHQHWLLDPSNTFLHHTMTAAVKMQEKVKAKYTARVGIPPTDGEMMTLMEAVDFAMSMAENYQIRWGTPLPDGYKIIAPEQKVQIPVEATRKTCHYCRGSGKLDKFFSGSYDVQSSDECLNCSGTGEEVHYLEGKLDGLLQHHSGRVDILEHKTYGSRPKEESLAHNDQFLAYMYIVTKLDVGDVGCIAYDGMWRRKEVPRGKTFEDLFSRYIITRSKHELDEFERFLPLELEAMADLYRHPETAYPNRVWQGCWDCRMDPICAAMSRGEDYEAIIRANYVERDDDIDEDDEATE